MSAVTRKDNAGNSLQAILRVLLVATSYVLAGRAASLLAIPPGYAAPFWPAAGIAAAAVLIHGRIVLAGVFAGSLALNLWIGFDAVSSGHLSALIAPVLIAIGAAVQALLGATLVRSGQGARVNLDTSRGVLSFLLATGPVACVISASMGSASLFAFGIIGKGEMAFTWWNWWIGDTIGVVVVAPLILIWSGAAGVAWRLRRMHVTLPIVVAVAIVVTSFVAASDRELHRIESEFNNTTAAVVLSLDRYLASVTDTVTSVQSLYDSSASVSGEEFRVFTERLLQSHPELLALSWNPYVTHRERAAFDHSAHADDAGWMQFTERNDQGALVRAANADTYVVVQFIEPRADNVAAIGFNVYSEPIRREAIQRTMASQRAVTTTRVQLVQNQESAAGLLMFAPVYSGLVDPAPGATNPPRGFVVAVIVAEQLVRIALDGLPLENISLRLSDRPEPSPPLVLLGNDAEALLQKDLKVAFGGREFLLEVSAGADYVTDHRAPGLWFVLAGGLLMSGMLGAFLLVLTGHTERERRRVNELQDVNERLADNIAWRHRFEQELSTEKARAEATLNSIADGVITIDTLGTVDYMNPVAEQLTGWSYSEAQGKPLAAVFRIHAEDDDDRSRDPLSLCRANTNDGPGVGALCLQSRDGKTVAIRHSCNTLRAANSDAGTVIAFQDVTEARKLARRIEHEATHDALTGLINRGEFQRRLARAIAGARERNLMHALCLMDLDHFKNVNDTAGHLVGDDLLRGICARIRKRTRSRDTLARLGGDEFALLLENCPPKRAVEIANQVLVDVSKYQMHWEGKTLGVGVSIGVVTIDAASQDATELLRSADKACYAAKGSGRNRVYISSPTLNSPRRVS